MFAYRDRRGPVEVAFTDRFGPAQSDSTGQAGLDLGSAAERGADNVVLVARALVGEAPEHQAAVHLMHQVHGCTVVEVGSEAPPTPPGGHTADAMLTSTPGHLLVARAADCVPILLGDPEVGVVAAVHAGRTGLLAGVVPRAVTALRGHGARAVTAWMGPHVCGRCYEVEDELRREVEAAVPGSGAETSWGTPSVDLGAGVRHQLATVSGVAVEVISSEACTVEDQRFWSYRREGRSAGRQAGLIWMRP